jgi:hypothetical protein
MARAVLAKKEGANTGTKLDSNVDYKNVPESAKWL